jgi:RNA recognition motif-containing protein
VGRAEISCQLTGNMGYRHTDNLYKNQSILLFKECYALEKIHGTSTHITFKPNQKELIFFSGGAPHALFLSLFNEEELYAKFAERFTSEVTVYGEGYGGSVQKMKHVYGDQLKFIGFEVKIGESWLNVPNAHDVCNNLGLEFVHYTRIPAEIEAIDEERDKPSVQAQRNGMGDDKMGEGIVLRPLVEVLLYGGHRVIVKHKRPEFSETKTPREVSPDKLQVMLEASKIADEWVTEMRLEHVLDKLPDCTGMEQTGKVIAAMQEDVYREAKGEILESKAALNAIAKKTAQLYKAKVTKIQ